MYTGGDAAAAVASKANRTARARTGARVIGSDLQRVCVSLTFLPSVFGPHCFARLLLGERGEWPACCLFFGIIRECEGYCLYRWRTRTSG